MQKKAYISKLLIFINHSPQLQQKYSSNPSCSTCLHKFIYVFVQQVSKIKEIAA